jgi:thiol-disulfide isomerase/thioredoxin
MKKSILLIAAVVLQLVCLAQAAKPMKTILKGKIEKSSRDFFILIHHGQNDTVKLGADGIFQVNIEQNDANYFTLQQAKQSLITYLLPADEVTINLKGINFMDSPQIEGKSKNYCQFLLEKQKKDKGLWNQFPYPKWATYTPENFMSLRDSIRNSRMQQLDAANTASKFISSFYTIEKNALEYQYVNDLILYRQASAETRTEFPKKFQDAIEAIDLNKSEMTYHEMYQQCALNLIKQEAGYEYSAGTDKSYLHYYELQVDKVCKRMSTEQGRNVMFKGLMQDILTNIGTQDISTLITKFEACCTDKKLIERVKKAAAQYEHMHPGKAAPEIMCYDAEGKNISLSSLRGKVIYIDVWATWCGPCKREIPELKKLEEEYHGKNIQFVSISTDKDVNAWKAFIAKEAMGGMQLHQSDNFDESISKLFMVNSIPRFIMIDSLGRIVSSDAPRPSSGEQIRTMINGVLK